MRGAAKGHELPELCAWKEAQRGAGIEPEYDNLQQPERGATERSLFAEQTGQCVYCGRRISLNDNQRHHIEHFRPRSKYPERQLDYANLFLSCGPQAEHGARLTCGAHKAHWFDELCHISPVPDPCADRFRFRSSGHIAGDGSPEADMMIEKLNLNHRELVADRQSIVEALDEELNAGSPPAALRDSFLAVDHHGARPGFAHVAIGYLNVHANP